MRRMFLVALFAALLGNATFNEHSRSTSLKTLCSMEDPVDGCHVNDFWTASVGLYDLTSVRNEGDDASIRLIELSVDEADFDGEPNK